MYYSYKDHRSCMDDKQPLSTSIDSEDIPTEQSPDSSDDSRNRKKNDDTFQQQHQVWFQEFANAWETHGILTAY